MKVPEKEDRLVHSWVNTLSWPDKLIARCFPRFFERYAPDEIKKQWAAHQARKR